MTILLNNIYSALEQGLIDQEQALYLIYTDKCITFPLGPKKLLALTKLKYIVSGKIGKKLYIEEDVSSNISGTIKPIYKSEISKKIAAKLVMLLGVVDPETNNLRFPGKETSIAATAENYLGGEGLIAYHYLIFLFMFPVADKQGSRYNKKWERHFFNKFEYKGARLRVRSKGTATAFKRIVKTKDMGVFLYGTYLFIQSCIRENKTFVKTITNYTKEYEEWYEEAEEIMSKTTDVESLFKITAANEGRLNIGL